MLAVDAGALAVKRLFLFGAVAGFDPEVKAQFGEFAKLLRTDADIRPLWQQRCMSAAWAAEHPSDLAAVIGWLDVSPRSTLAAEYDAMSQAPDLRSRLGEIAVPTVVRTGENDASWPLAWTQSVVAQIPGATMEVLPGAGHALLYEDRADSVASVVRWAMALAG